MALVRFDPFDPVSNLLGLQSEIQRFLRNPSFSLGPSGYGAFPPVNIFEDAEGNAIIIAEAPGIDPAQLVITGRGNTLTISGERAREEVPELKGYHRRERRFGKFSRSIQLSNELDLNTANASYQAGVLSVRVNKAEAAKPRQISVQTV
jgi:HSP20 family protein